MKKLLSVILVLSVTIFAYAQDAAPNPDYKLLASRDFVQSKNYYLLTLFQHDREVSKLLKSDRELSAMAREKVRNLAASLEDCGKNATCYTEGITFSEEEIKLAGERLETLYGSSDALQKLVREHLIPSGTYLLYADLPPAQLLVKAWEQEALGINHAIEVYAEGKPPNYPNIDSIAFDRSNERYAALVFACTEAVLDEAKEARLFFEPSMITALRFLEINHRGHAADFEPMAETVNKAACERIPSVDWDKYTYTVILIPGAGLDNPDDKLSPAGMLRCRVGARRYFEGLAPFIVVSGGRVHPYQTPYSEAYEMKEYLVHTMGVPENAVIMEPHARHTTTNMRNCARLIYRYGMPFEKPCITSTSRSQSYYITDQVMQERCLKELGYAPYRNGKRLSDTEAEFYPVLTALQIDVDEPLDP